MSTEKSPLFLALGAQGIALQLSYYFNLAQSQLRTPKATLALLAVVASPLAVVALKTAVDKDRLPVPLMIRFCLYYSLLMILFLLGPQHSIALLLMLFVLLISVLIVASLLVQEIVDSRPWTRSGMVQMSKRLAFLFKRGSLRKRGSNE
jgi:hypothetical protein